VVEDLLKYIKQKIILTEYEQTKIASVCQVKKLKKRQFLLQEGDVWKYHAFITKGCLRTYTIDDKGNEHIIYFAVENWWTGDRESLASGQPSIFNIDTLEDCELILIRKENFEKLCDDIPVFNDMVNNILQKSFLVAQGRIHSFISLTAEEKYIRFLEKYPHLPMRVPQGMIASYLGITAETLSRVRKQTARKV
jgi:CRP-like cAMP-binding protein